MEDDSEIDGFLDSFLSERGPRKPRATYSTKQLQSGLALHVKAGQVVRKKPSERRDVVFHNLLEDMANDLMERGTCARACSREVSPRSPREPLVVSPAHSSSDPKAFFQTSPWPRKEDDLVLEDHPHDSDWDDEVSPEKSGIQHLVDDSHFRLQIDDSNEPRSDISVSVVLDTGKSVLKDYRLELDAPLVDLFTHVEKKSRKEVQAMIGPHGNKVERSELPIKWSGLKDGDVISVVLYTHPKLEDRRIDMPSHTLLASPPTVSSKKSPQVRSPGLSKAWQTMDFPDLGPVSMGGFAETMVGVSADLGHQSSTSTSGMTSPAAQNHGTLFGTLLETSDRDESVELPSHWFGMGMQSAETSDDIDGGNEEVVHIKNSSNATQSLPIPPEMLPDEFAPLPEDTWTPPPHQHHKDKRQETVEKGCMEELPQKPKLSPLPPRPSRNTSSPAPLLRATSSPSKGLHDSLNLTPSRRNLGPPKMQKLDADNVKKRQEEMQKRSDAIWANIAANLEPAPSTLGTKKLLKQR